MSEAAKPIVHIVEDDQSLSTALSRLLRHAGYSVVTYNCAGSFLVAPRTQTPACLLLDLSLPGPNGLELQQALIRLGLNLPIVFMSARPDVASAVSAFRQGACDFLIKPFDGTALLQAIAKAVASQRAEQPVAPTHRPSTDIALNARERIVLRELIAGRLNKQIAADLSVSERTIKTCRAQLMRRFGAGSFAELVRRATPWFNETLT
ncbi:MAG: response regulator [Rhodocyclaceae bacterium]